VAPPPPPPPLALSAGGSFLATSLRCSFTPAAAAATAAGAIPGLSQQPHVSLHHGIKSQQPKNAARWWCARSRPAIPTDRAGTEGVCGAGAHAPSLQKDVPCPRHRQQRPSRYPGGPPAAAAARVARGEGGRPSSHGSAAGVNGRCARKTSCGRPVQGLQRSRCSLTAGQAVAACCMRPTDNHNGPHSCCCCCMYRMYGRSYTAVLQSLYSCSTAVRIACTHARTCPLTGQSSVGS
jgi:hypothetical protein